MQSRVGGAVVYIVRARDACLDSFLKLALQGRTPQIRSKEFWVVISLCKEYCNLSSSSLFLLLLFVQESVCDLCCTQYIQPHLYANLKYNIGKYTLNSAATRIGDQHVQDWELQYFLGKERSLSRVVGVTETCSIKLAQHRLVLMGIFGGRVVQPISQNFPHPVRILIFCKGSLGSG